MIDERLATEIRAVLDRSDEPNPRLEDRVIAAIDWRDKPRPARRWWTRWKPVSALVAALIVVAMATTYVSAANSAGQAKPISEAAAIADAMKQLPNNGAGYQVVKTELEASSKHFEFVGPNGNSYSEDSAQECLVMPPLPRLPGLEPCRYYPVWMVALSSAKCQTVIGINAYTGRFAGGGSATVATQSQAPSMDDCAITPEAPDVHWFQPMWG